VPDAAVVSAICCRLRSPVAGKSAAVTV